MRLIFLIISQILFVGSLVAQTFTLGDWSNGEVLISELSPAVGTKADFALYVDGDLVDPEIFNVAKSDGSDIRVTLADSITEIPYMLENWNVDSTWFDLWCKKSVTHNIRDTIIIWYGNALAAAYDSSDTYGSHATCSDFEFVHLYNTDHDSIANAYANSAGTNYWSDSASTSYAEQSPDVPLTNKLIGPDTAKAKVSIPLIDIPANDRTVMMFTRVNTTDLTGSTTVWEQRDIAAGDPARLRIIWNANNDRIQFTQNNGSWQTSAPSNNTLPSANEWHLVSVHIDDTAPSVTEIRYDGVSQSLAVNNFGTGYVAPTGDAVPTLLNSSNGQVDIESIWVCNTNLNQNQTTRYYNNHVDHDNYWTYGGTFEMPSTNTDNLNFINIY